MSTDLDTKVEARNAGRLEADECIEVVMDVAEGLFKAHGAQACEAFWKKVREALWPRNLAEEAAVADAMTDAEAREFGASTMPFGKHTGERVDAVPLEYLLWLDGDEWRRDLARYLRSRRIQTEQAARGDE
ncbi:MAG TPA: DUF3820 family protein [Pirellulales bacterium]|jgi:hypothetical protein|nr:DUF3820 family protein [Pirellulales bacterium]